MDDYRAPPGRSVPFGVPPLEFVTELSAPPASRAPEPGARSRRGTPRCARGDPDRLKGAAARRRGSPPVPREGEAGEGDAGEVVRCSRSAQRRRKPPSPASPVGGKFS